MLIFVGFHLSIILLNRLHEFRFTIFNQLFLKKKTFEGAAPQIMEQKQISAYVLENQILHLYYGKI